MPRTLVLQGPVDVAHAAEVRPLLHQASVSGVGDLVVDISQVTRIDGTGLGMLAAAGLRVRRRGGRFQVVAAGPEVPGRASAAQIADLLSDADRNAGVSRLALRLRGRMHLRGRTTSARSAAAGARLRGLDLPDGHGARRSSA